MATVSATTTVQVSKPVQPIAQQQTSKGWSYGKIAVVTVVGVAGVALVATAAFLAYRHFGRPVVPVVTKNFMEEFEKLHGQSPREVTVSILEKVKIAGQQLYDYPMNGGAEYVTAFKSGLKSFANFAWNPMKISGS